MHVFPLVITVNTFHINEYKNARLYIYTHAHRYSCILTYVHIYVVFMRKIPFKNKNEMFSYIFPEEKKYKRKSLQKTLALRADLLMFRPERQLGMRRRMRRVPYQP